MPQAKEWIVFSIGSEGAHLMINTPWGKLYVHGEFKSKAREERERREFNEAMRQQVMRGRHG